jgi:hypothetical protein
MSGTIKLIDSPIIAARTIDSTQIVFSPVVSGSEKNNGLIYYKIL